MTSAPCVGFISASTVSVPWIGSSFLPTTKVVVTGMNVRGHNAEEFERAEHELRRAVHCLAVDGTDGVLANVVPLSATWGYERETAFRNELSTSLGVVFHTASSAIVEACLEQGWKRIAMVTAYTERTNKLLAGYFAQAGLDVAGSTGLAASGPSESGRLSGQAFVRDAERLIAGSDDCEALVLGNRLSDADLLVELSRSTGLPVLHGTSAGTWQLARTLGLRWTGPSTGLPDINPDDGTPS